MKTTKTPAYEFVNIFAIFKSVWTWENQKSYSSQRRPTNI